MRKIRRKSTKKKKKLFLSALVIFVVLAVTCLAGVYVAAEAGSEKILRNVYVDGIRIGGLSPSEAEKLLEKEFAGRKITVAVGEEKETFSLDELGLMYKTNVIVGKAYEIGKSRNFGKNVVDICASFFTPTKLSSSQALVTVDPGSRRLRKHPDALHHKNAALVPQLRLLIQLYDFLHGSVAAARDHSFFLMVCLIFPIW